MYFHQSESNVVAHGMSSSEEAKYRYEDVDPELLQDPYDVAREAEHRRAQQAKEQQSRHYVDVELGRVSMTGLEMVGE